MAADFIIPQAACKMAPVFSIYLHIAAKSFQKNLAYRAANLAGIVTNTFFGAIYISIYTALLQGRGAVGGLDVRDAITYAVISQSLLMVMSAFGNKELSEAIIKGQIVTDLSRPVDFYFYWAAHRSWAGGLLPDLPRGADLRASACCCSAARLPADRIPGCCSSGCIAAGMLLSFAFRFITNSLAFWTTDARGINYLANTVILFFAGFIVPLNFFPPWLRSRGRGAAVSRRWRTCPSASTWAS